jgi:hypothetical protein
MEFARRIISVLRQEQPGRRRMFPISMRARVMRPGLQGGLYARGRAGHIEVGPRCSRLNAAPAESWVGAADHRAAARAIDWTLYLHG